MADTKTNLQAAFAGESQANRKYLFFAENASAGGNKQIARLFRAAAEAETVHARNHLKVLGEIKSDKENLEAAIAGENYEFTIMYPGFIEQAKQENNKEATGSFNLANKVEQIHHKLFQEALSRLKAARLSEKCLTMSASSAAIRLKVTHRKSAPSAARRGASSRK